YVSANYTNLFTAKFRNSRDIVDEDGDITTDSFASGNRLTYAPKHIASVNFGYQHPIGFEARIGVDYVSKQYGDNSNTTVDSLSGLTGTIPSYTLINASASYRPIGSKATFFVSGNNLADKEYLASRVDGMVAGRQRQVFGGVRYDF
ncbi:MAG: TonB-dependent receptor, partial [Methylobacillus glycogenes]|nr:TonB-dependent receptor [Methylobacillus glycogenes]